MNVIHKMLFVVLLTSAVVNSYAQKDSILTAQFEKLHKNSPQEKVHIHFDKPFYAPGDTIWFAGYLVNAQKNFPAERSHILYVELTDSKNRVCKTLQLPVSMGFTSGDIVVPDTLNEGIYRIRAYTSWMRNFDAGFFFNKIIKIVNPSPDPKIAQAGQDGSIVNPDAARAGATAYDIQFFPEGGQLVNGLRSVIGFKVTGQSGKGAPASGSLVDELNNTILNFYARNDGIGEFLLTPLSDKNYTAVVKFPDGITKLIKLPTVQKSGYVLSADNNKSDSLYITLQATSDLLNKDNMTFVPLSNGVPLFYMTTGFPDKQLNITIPKDKIPGGIIQLALLNGNKELLAERLVFNRYFHEVKISIAALRPAYHKREKVKFELRAHDRFGKPVTGSFSLAVINSGLVDTDEVAETTIFSNLLLSADLPGCIEQPDYYFSNPSVSKDKELDQLMLTQRWQRFAWKELVMDKLPEMIYPAEDKITVSGKISSAGKASVKYIPVNLLAGQLGKGVILDTLTDEQGKFIFHLADSLKYLPIRLQVKGNRSYSIMLDEHLSQTISNAQNEREPQDPLGHAKLGQASESYNSAVNQNGNLAETNSGLHKMITLKEVAIKSKKLKLTGSHSANLNGAGGADQVILPETLEKIADLSSLSFILHGVVPTSKGFKLTSTIGTNTRDVLILVDGMNGIDDLNEISPRDIESIEFMKSLPYTAIYGIRGAGGVLLITTKKGGVNKKSTTLKAPNSLTFELPFYRERQFYQPVYEKTENETGSVDRRTTVYWKPDIITGKNGKAEVLFYNNDVPGNYKIIIEGISARGELCRQVYSYKVE